ncbi:MAG: DUF4390 domain-containing protein, partial [Gemmatimonadales bacterium]
MLPLAGRFLRRFAPEVRAAVMGLLLTLAAAGPGRSQTPGAVQLQVRLAPDSASSGARAPIVRSQHLLDDGRWLSALRSGLPVRLHYRVEVWRSREGWFDTFEREAEWDVVVHHEPLLDQYTLLTIVGRRARERRYATLDALSAALEFAYRVNVQPARPGRYYFAASLQISTLSDSDLDELQRFLEGDVGDVAHGKERVGDALG